MRLLALILALLAALAAAEARSQPKAGFDLFLFVRSFSPSFCEQVTCSIDPV